MAATGECDIVSDAGTDSTYCSALENPKNISQVSRVQPQRNAKRKYYVMFFQRSLKGRKRLHEITCLIEDHLSGKKFIDVCQAKGLLLELESMQQNCMSFGRKYKKDFSMSCKHLKLMLAHKNANNLRSSLKTERERLQLNQDNNPVCSSLTSEIMHAESGKVSPHEVSFTQSIIGPTPYDYFQNNATFNVMSLEHLEDLNSYRTEDQKSKNVQENTMKNISNEVISNTCVPLELSSLDNLQLDCKQSVASEKNLINPPDKVTQCQEENLFFENDKNKINYPIENTTLKDASLIEINSPDKNNEKSRLAETFVITPTKLQSALKNIEQIDDLPLKQTIQTEFKERHYADKNKNKSGIAEFQNEVPTNAEQVNNVVLTQTIQSQCKEIELQELGSQNIKNLKSDIFSKNRELNSVTNIFDDELDEAVNQHSLVLTLSGWETFNDLTYTAKAEKSKYASPTTVKDAKNVITDSEKFQKLPQYVDNNLNFLQSRSEYSDVNYRIREEQIDSIGEIIETGVIPNADVWEEENLEKVYSLTDKEFVRIAARINVPYEDLMRVVEAVVQSDGESERSASVISASQSPAERRYSSNNTQSSLENCKFSNESIF